MQSGYGTAACSSGWRRTLTISPKSIWTGIFEVYHLSSSSNVLQIFKSLYDGLEEVKDGCVLFDRHSSVDTSVCLKVSMVAGQLPMYLNFSSESDLLPLNSLFVLLCLEWGTLFCILFKIIIQSLWFGK